MIKKVKNSVPGIYVISNPNWEEIVGMFYKNELQKQIKKNLELKKLREKVINYMLNGKDTIICLIVGLIKNAV